MNILILMGSPRLHGNTAELCRHFMEEAKVQKAHVQYMELDKMKINPCRACYICQDVEEGYGCVQKDDMIQIAESILWADAVILATPIFSWYCTARMKAVLDRHYGFNKYYGSAKGCLWEGKKIGILATHGYAGDYATEPFEMGIKRLCIHSRLHYIGMYSVQDQDNLASFQTKEAIEGARAFARKVMGEGEGI